MAKTNKQKTDGTTRNRSAKIEDALMNTLKNSGLERSHLSELVSIASNLGVVPIKGFPYGTPDPMGIVLETRFTPQQLASFMGRLPNYSNVNLVTVFPKGIPVVTEFFAQIQIQ